MTGFGKSVCEIAGKKITIEIRSLNSKQLDLNLRIPPLIKDKELEIRNEVAQKVERGKIDLGFYVESTGEMQTVTINRQLAESYYRELRSLSGELKEEHSDYLSMIIRMPDIFKSERQELSDEDWKELRSGFSGALNELNRFRIREGNSLEKEVESRVQNILRLLESIAERDPERMKNIRERLRKNVSELMGKEKFDESRFEQELLYYIEKLDITEEKVRLKTHCDFFISVMKEESSGGRKLGFISQEIGREINTIGSKANDAAVQKLVVNMKDELEKIKEQLNNIL
jgi:uncharacterized protein (TIGR00255 family)